jgi:hypothetical protein
MPGTLHYTQTQTITAPGSLETQGTGRQRELRSTVKSSAHLTTLLIGRSIALTRHRAPPLCPETRGENLMEEESLISPLVYDPRLNIIQSDGASMCCDCRPCWQDG